MSDLDGLSRLAQIRTVVLKALVIAIYLEIVVSATRLDRPRRLRSAEAETWFIHFSRVSCLGGLVARRQVPVNLTDIPVDEKENLSWLQ